MENFKCSPNSQSLLHYTRNRPILMSTPYIFPLPIPLDYGQYHRYHWYGRYFTIAYRYQLISHTKYVFSRFTTCLVNSIKSMPLEYAESKWAGVWRVQATSCDTAVSFFCLVRWVNRVWTSDIFSQESSSIKVGREDF